MERTNAFVANYLERDGEELTALMVACTERRRELLA
jgi:hypothetical protein